MRTLKVLFLLVVCLSPSCKKKGLNTPVYVGLKKDSVYLGQEKKELLARKKTVHFDELANSYVAIGDIEFITDSATYISTEYFDFNQNDILSCYKMNILITTKLDVNKRPILAAIRSDLFQNKEIGIKIKEEKNRVIFNYSAGCNGGNGPN